MNCTKAERNNIYDPKSEQYIGPEQVELVKEWAPDCDAGLVCVELAESNKDNAITASLVFVSPVQNDTVFTSSLVLQGSIENPQLFQSLTINGTSVAVSGGQWSWNTPSLTGGLNEFYFVLSFTFEGSIHVSPETLSVYYAQDLEPPGITVTSHRDSQTVYSSSVLVLGTASDPAGIASVDVNSVPADLLNDTTWSYSGTLVLGQNSFSIASEDNAGNSATMNFTMFYSLDNPSANDWTGPSIELLSPAMGLVEDSSVTITIRVTDENGIAWVRLDGDDMSRQGDSTYTMDKILEEGMNTFLVVAQDSSVNHNLDSLEPWLVYSVDVTGPDLQLVSHTDGQVVTGSIVTIQVSAEDPSGISEGIVTINGDPMTFLGGLYTSQETMVPGINNFQIKALDSKFNENTLDFTLNYIPAQNQ
ncbi:hypothetical protein ACFL5V_07525 [Fibrobacterota bacterium]